MNTQSSTGRYGDRVLEQPAVVSSANDAQPQSGLAHLVTNPLGVKLHSLCASDSPAGMHLLDTLPAHLFGNDGAVQG